MAMHGKLMIIEAGDGSGKATQTEMLFNRLVQGGYRVKRVTFPNYASEASALIKMYLNGEFGTRPGDVSPYIASTFYAVDRYASFKKEWAGFYQEGGIIIADRYTTSNMVHQAAKIEDMEERVRYLDWLVDLEFSIFRLPAPDAVLFLDMPPAFAQELIRERKNKMTGGAIKDIHERDTLYLEKSYHTSLWLAERFGWHRIPCTEGAQIRTIEAIHQDIYAMVNPLL